MKKETIDELIELAIAAYNKKSKPGEFARAAAHKAALDAASRHSPDLADFASLAAAATFYVEITEAISFSARVADKAVSMVNASNSYQSEWERYSATIFPRQVTENYFNSLADAPDKVSRAFIEAVTPSYDTTSVLDVVARNKAKRAALYVYFDTYSVARSAYIRALFIANYKSKTNAAEAFRSAVSTRLKHDLTYDIIDAGFFLNLLSSLIFRIFLGILLLAGIIGIIFAAFNLTPLPFIPFVSISSAVSAGTIGFMVGSFFAKKQCDKLVEDNDNRAEQATII